MRHVTTEERCHCGTEFRGADHCPECFCEQYEAHCDRRFRYEVRMAGEVVSRHEHYAAAKMDARMAAVEAMERIKDEPFTTREACREAVEATETTVWFAL